MTVSDGTRIAETPQRSRVRVFTTFRQYKFSPAPERVRLCGWLRSTVGGTTVYGRRTDPVLRSACSRRVTTMWVNRPLQVSRLGQLSLSFFRGR